MHLDRSRRIQRPTRITDALEVDRIKNAFDLAEPIPEFFGEQDPIPLIDVWPGLENIFIRIRSHINSYAVKESW